LADGVNRPQPGADAGAGNIGTAVFAAVPDLDETHIFDLEGRKTEEKKKRPATANEEEKVVILASDCRKRVVIFQPKKKKMVLKGDNKKTQITVPKASKRIVKVDKAMSVAELAQVMGVKAPALIRKLMTDGVTANMNTALDFDTIALIAPEFNFEAE